MLRQLCLAGVLALIVLAGVAGGYAAYSAYGGEDAHTRPVSAPLPHQIPPRPGAASFRFAMAHDVIHERYPKHGPAFYIERERLARERLKAIPPDSDEAFDLTDDICAGLDRLGKPADAMPLLRDKLERQVKMGLGGRDLYTTYANLGTFLVHANMGKAMRGDKEARAAVEEGLGFVEKSMVVNPDAHFGRETWQAVIIKFILSAIDEPELLTTHDCIGNRLSRTFPTELFRPADPFDRSAGYARPFHTDGLTFTMGVELTIRDRTDITQVGTKGAAKSWVWAKEGDFPFDEPMLGIIGMWRQGGGANPHFALCMGEVMLRVGQRYIAWAAFERAGRLAERYWPDPATQQFLRDHCARRQKQIEETLPPSEVADLWPNFEAELAFGEKYQKEYQEYEAAKIAGGASIHDKHFWYEFNQSHPSIATVPGPEEYLVTHNIDYVGPKVAAVGGAVFGVGLVAFLAAAFWPRRKPSRSPLS